MDHSVLVISGFHRSATSLCGYWLHDAGLDMGFDLMPGGISNPFGHFEDLPVVKLHDQWLADSGTSWQFFDEVSLNTNPQQNSQLSDYVRLRDSLNNCWGIKDPRVCLFLPTWQKVLGQRGRYLVVLRHWGACIESLLKRHSEQIAFPINEQALNANIAFWEQPTLAARMWLAYCKRILSFLQTHSQQSLVLTQKELFSGINLPELVKRRLGFQLETCMESPIAPALIGDSASIRIKQMLPSSLVSDLDLVWNRLLEYSQGINNVDEHITWRDDAFVSCSSWPSSNRFNYTIQSVVSEGKPFLSLNEFVQKYNQFDDNQKLADWFDTLNVNPHHDKAVLVNFIINHVFSSQFSEQRIVVLALARWVGRQNEVASAKHCWLLCLQFSPVPAYVYHALTLIELDEGNWEAALNYNKQALKQNSNNAHFWLTQSKLHFILGNADASLSACNQALLIGEGQPVVVALVASRLDTLARTEQGLELLESIMIKGGELRNIVSQTYVRLKLKSKATDAKRCVKEYKQTLLVTIEDKSFYLFSACNRTGSQVAENDLYARISSHWKLLVE